MLHVDLGLDKIFVWKFDEQAGMLVPNEPPAVSLPPGDGPRHARTMAPRRSIDQLLTLPLSRMLRIAKPETLEQLEEYFDLRWRVLRAPWKQPRGSERDACDSSADHVTARDQNGRLLGIGRVHLNDETEAQIRYMATEEGCRGLGVGRAIIEKLESLARAHGVERIVLNARENVVGFYEHLGYSVVGDGPMLFDEIIHSKMEKRL